VSVQKKILNLLHPLLRPISQWYLSKTHTYVWRNIKVKVYPGVFHPGFFFSTKIFLNYLKNQSLEGLKILELGAGSGLISIQLAKQNAIVTASDINPLAIKGLHENFQHNNIHATIVESNLFDKLIIENFDMIIINPPYYAKRPLQIQDRAWYCGENFEYFQMLFQQIASASNRPNVLMILSEDCNISYIQRLAKNNGLVFSVVYQEKIMNEQNTIFNIKVG
jgi:release factor glutamine methyltransferase